MEIITYLIGLFVVSPFIVGIAIVLMVITVLRIYFGKDS